MASAMESVSNPDADGAGNRNLAGLASLVLGLAFFWSLFRRAGAVGIVTLTGLGRTAGLVAFYTLFAGFSAVACSYIWRTSTNDALHGQRSSFLPPACLVCTFLAALLLGACHAIPGTPLSWAALTVSALATCLLGMLALQLCARPAPLAENSPLALTCTSALVSIVITFAFSDVIGLGAWSAGAYLVLSALGLCLAARLLGTGTSPHMADGADASRALPGWSRGHAAALCVALLASAILKTLADGMFQDDDMRLVKHLVGLVGLSLPLATLLACPHTAHAASFYILMGLLVLGAFLSAVPAPAAAHHMGAAFLTTSCTLAQALLMAWASKTRRHVAGPLAFCLANALAGILAYGLLEGTDFDSSRAELLGCVAMLALAGIASVALGVLCSHEVKGARNLQVGQAAPHEDVDAQARFAALYGLTLKEATVAACLYQGQAIKEIARAECLSVNTIQSHSKSIYRKMGVHSRRELIDAIDAAAERELP